MSSSLALIRPKPSKRRKVNHACLYCRRSHMTCDDSRPCARCVKRGIGDKCHDESTRPTGKPAVSYHRTFRTPSPPKSTKTLGNEFAVLSDFLETLGNDDAFFNESVAPSVLTNSSYDPPVQPEVQPEQSSSSVEVKVEVIPAATKTEKFLLTAADQESGSRDQRLKRVIQSKYEAGLLKPHNYVKGYARLSRWMDRKYIQILQPLSVLRPKFRDLVFIEEAFERMLLDYDRVFSAMGFTELLGLDGNLMRDGRLCIYELMTEDSAKYGAIAFNSEQKTFKKKDGREETCVDTCASLTDTTRWMGSMIIGNFIVC
ncbi:hypothetical protein DL96DRAFT_1666768 [Flagelloscypha sp. PMI_526]|nr:hypothetical protein DL96DRAFT_1666768 [Flagelloscypha sp. PMI_526]